MIVCPSCGFENSPSVKFCGECGTKLLAVPSPREVRKTVTVLFADVSGSTALGERLDPEALRSLMTRYFTEIKTIIDRHGGTVEKFIGDAVMAVFGIPVLHEDDALRAVRAADEIRLRLGELNSELIKQRGLTIAFRTGICTGEVVAGDPSTGQTLVTGDTVNTAARLEQAAPAGEILLSLPTYQLVRDAVTVLPAEPVIAKGKAQPVPAYRLVGVDRRAEGHVRRLDTPLVGREQDLETIKAAYRRAVASRSPQLITVLGSAGVGKSRLTSEFVKSVAHEALILKGRCLSYGEGITYWPLREIVFAAADIIETDTAADAMTKLRALLEGQAEADVLARRIGAALALHNESSPQEEVFWATRKLLEHLSRQRPLVTLWEDVHWAEPTLLDLLEYIVDLAADSELILLVTARAELVEKRPSWGGNRPNSLALHLEPLASGAATELFSLLPGGETVPQRLRQRILAAADGNPLYLQEMIAMLIDDGHIIEREGNWSAVGQLESIEVPLSVRALLAARIDALPNDERRAAERASVAGRVFEAAAIRQLAGASAEVGGPLLGLVRKDLIRPERSELSAGDAFKFRHLLIQEAAYEALPKSERAELHEKFADWLQSAGRVRTSEMNEIVGYHLERAYRHRMALGEAGEGVDRLADRTCEALFAAAAAASLVDDHGAAILLLDRAWHLAREDATKAVVGVALSRSLANDGRLDESERIASATISLAGGIGDEVSMAHAMLTVVQVQALFGRDLADFSTTVVDVEAMFERNNNAAGLARVERMKSYLSDNAADCAAAAERAAEYARQAGVRDEEAAALLALAECYAIGSTHARVGIELVTTLVERLEDSPYALAKSLGVLALFRAMQLEFVEAHQLLARKETLLVERRKLSDQFPMYEAMVYRLEGKPALVIPALKRGLKLFESRGDVDRTSSLAILLARALVESGDEVQGARVLKRVGDEILAGEATGYAEHRFIRAEIARRAGKLVEAEQDANAGNDALDGSDWLDLRGYGQLMLATIARDRDAIDVALRAARAAAALYERKGNLASGQRADRLLRELEDGTSSTAGRW